MTEETPEERDRRSKRERQRRWRERTAGRDDDGDGESRAGEGLGASVAMHFTDRECAALDTLAAMIYRDHPHDPKNGIVSTVFPGRAAAIRELIRRFRANSTARRPASRQACGEFWRAEAAYRKAKTTDTSAQPPVPPWRRR